MRILLTIILTICTAIWFYGSVKYYTCNIKGFCSNENNYEHINSYINSK